MGAPGQAVLSVRLRSRRLPASVRMCADGYYLRLYYQAVVPAPWHFLYFLPEPQGQGSFLPTLAAPRATCCGAVLPLEPAMRACSSSFFLRRWNCASRSSMEVEARLRGGCVAGCWSPSVGA